MKLTLLSLSLLLTISVFAQFRPFQNDRAYQVYLDLNEVTNDRIPVTFIPPVIHADSVEFHMPRIIPGTYSVAEYGRFVHDFTAFTASGEELMVKRLDTNRWRIFNATELYGIEYQVADTYDSEIRHGIFEPAGTTIEDSVFLLNNFGFIGYLNQYKEMPFRLHIEKPKGFFGSTALPGEMGDTLDIFTAENYFQVHDNPIMYCIPDTAVRTVGGAEVLVSLYSPGNMVSSDTAMEAIADVLQAAASFMGGKLPVDKYAVLIYCVSVQNAGTSYGALEHHTSTVLYMPEFGGEQFYSGVRDITSHEFFHIITPLNIHSEFIHDFDFINPEMSKHIWFYEGVTEYNSHHVQVRNGIYQLEEFLDVMRQKMITADDFNQDLPLTVASSFTIDYFHDQYYNFYQKGALAGMALDLKLIQLSDGEYSLRQLLEDLGQTYGPDTFFYDDEFFDIITDMTYPEVREFFARHYEGAEPLPLVNLLNAVGIQYNEYLQHQRISYGNMELSYNFETERLLIEGTDNMDEFGEDLGFEVGDEIIEFNGQVLNINNFQQVLQDFYANTEAGDRVEVLVARPDGKEGYDEEKLKGKAILTEVFLIHYLSPVSDPDENQQRLQNVWLGR